MKKTVLWIPLLSALAFAGLASHVTAEEVVLCVNEVDQYVISVNSREDCVAPEKPVVFSGPDMAGKKGLMPVATFQENEECGGDGMTVNIGFDENDDGLLESSEIQRTDTTCSQSIGAASDSGSHDKPRE